MGIRCVNGGNGSGTRRVIMRAAAWAVLPAILCLWFVPPVQADWFDDSPPAWEPLLRGGKIGGDERNPSTSGETSEEAPSVPGPISPRQSEDAAASIDLTKIMGITGPAHQSPPLGPAIPKPTPTVVRDYYRAPFKVLSLRRIPPLYSSPVLPGEGVWEWKDLPTDANGWPVVYKTSYRPSVEYPNALVHMLLFDMKRLSMKLYVGSGEPGASRASSQIPPDENHLLVAVTNALWKQRHSGDAGTVYRGTVLKELAPGVATLVTYEDGSVDILEWSETTSPSMVKDAKQLQHLIVNDGKVVTSIVKNGQVSDSEIGLGYLLTETQPSNEAPMWWGGYWRNPQPEHTSGSEWFIASRSAFGIRKDGNLVFAVGHHISTKDLAKALVLAGCTRALHADANPYNVLGNLYYSDGNGGFLKKAKLSPDQSSDSVSRYVGRSYSSDFYGFFLKGDGKGTPREAGRYSHRDDGVAGLD
ncbi:MAG: phosphodiester glycosidase family protein [Pseudomonadota bacterium]